MRKVLQFPKARSKRALALQKLEAQRFFLGMSLFSLTLVAVFANEQIMKVERPVYVVSNQYNPTLNEQSASQFDRAIASVQPVHVFRDLEWEHQLAKRLGSKTIDSGRSPASVGGRVTLMDDLKYGPLAGKYSIRSIASAGSADTESRVNEIEYVQSDEVTDRPVRLTDTRSFLMRYKSLMKVQYANAELAYQTEKEEVWQLFDGSQNMVGRAHVSLDGRGQLLGMKVENL